MAAADPEPDADERTIIVVDGPLDTRATLAPLRHGATDPTIRFASDGIWRAARFASGPALIHLDDTSVDPRSGGELRARAWGPGSADALAGLPDLLGLHDDPSAFDPGPHPVIADLHRRNLGLRFGRGARVFDVLVPTILGQKVQSDAARRSYARLVRWFSEPAPGLAGLYLPLDPDRVACLPYEAFHRADVERRRAETVRLVARRAPSLERLSAATPADASATLQSLPGIGAWTASFVTMYALGDPDSVVVGDLHLPHLVAWVLAGEPRADDARMLELLAPFAPQRGRAQRLLKRSGRRAPRYGPRLSVRSIRGL